MQHIGHFQLPLCNRIRHFCWVERSTRSLIWRLNASFLHPITLGCIPSSSINPSFISPVASQKLVSFPMNVTPFWWQTCSAEEFISSSLPWVSVLLRHGRILLPMTSPPLARVFAWWMIWVSFWIISWMVIIYCIYCFYRLTAASTYMYRGESTYMGRAIASAEKDQTRQLSSCGCL